MEGAVLGGKLAAEVIARRAAGLSEEPVKPVDVGIIQKMQGVSKVQPKGIVIPDKETALAYGGGVMREREDNSALFAREGVDAQL